MEPSTPTVEPASDGRQIARVNYFPDGALEEPAPDAASMPALGEGEARTNWGAPALGLGAIAILLTIIALVVILQGVFRMMPK